MIWRNHKKEKRPTREFGSLLFVHGCLRGSTYSCVTIIALIMLMYKLVHLPTLSGLLL